MAGLTPAGRQWFLDAAQKYAFDPDRILSECCVTKSLRSLRSLATPVSGLERRIASYRHHSDGPAIYLPTPRELQGELIPITESLRARCPYVTTNLGVSNPAASPDLVSINVLVRLYDSAGRQQIKIKIGSFADESGRLFWEVGYVDIKKSIRGDLRDLLGQEGRDPGDYFLLRRLVDCTKNFIARRKEVAGLDITPAYYHVTPLCRRLGGVPEDKPALDEHLAEIERACMRDAEPGAERLSRQQRRVMTSWLLEKGRLKGNDGEAMVWSPPRFIWKRE